LHAGVGLPPGAAPKSTIIAWLDTFQTDYLGDLKGRMIGLTASQLQDIFLRSRAWSQQQDVANDQALVVRLQAFGAELQNAFSYLLG
jgi:hypothetical protein